nr:FAD-dependent oxidoreductase [Angustibacter aerolatus]
MGVDVVTGRRVVTVRRDHVVLDDGTRLATDVTVYAVGTDRRAPYLAGLPQADDGRVLVDGCLRAVPGVWAAGDVATVLAKGGGLAPGMAGTAILSGTAVGRNVAASLLGRRPSGFECRDSGRAAALGPGRGLLHLTGAPPSSGRGAYVGRLLFFLWYVPSRRQAGRIVRRRLAGRVRPVRPVRPAPSLAGAVPSRPHDRVAGARPADVRQPAAVADVAQHLVAAPVSSGRS